MFLRVNHLRRNAFHDVEVPEELWRAARAGDFVILEWRENLRQDVGKVVFKHDFEHVEPDAPRVLRLATQEDLGLIAQRQQEEREAFQVFLEGATRLQLPMKPLQVFFSFDGQFGDFLFTAEERVDFRELVRELTGKYRKRIFLEQVNPRERAALASGCGSCGRTLCCSTFLKDRPPVVMQSVRSQNLMYRDREKLTGLCGKLKCCLNYELEVYEDLAKDFPPMHAQVRIVSTGMKGKVIGRSILDQQVRVLPEKDGPPVMVRLDDVAVLSRDGDRGSQGGTALAEALSS